jgi:hypothetical protein
MHYHKEAELDPAMTTETENHSSIGFNHCMNTLLSK